MKIKNLKINPKIWAIILSAVLMTPTLSGCGKSTDTKYNTDLNRKIASVKFNKAIMFGEGTATIIDIETWFRTSDSPIVRVLPSDDLTPFATSFMDIKFVYDDGTSITAEEFARLYAGDDVVINYYDPVQQKNRK